MTHATHIPRAPILSLPPCWGGRAATDRRGKTSRFAGPFYTPSADFPAEAPRPGATTHGKNGTPGLGHIHGGHDEA